MTLSVSLLRSQSRDKLLTQLAELLQRDGATQIPFSHRTRNCHTCQTKFNSLTTQKANRNVCHLNPTKINHFSNSNAKILKLASVTFVLYLKGFSFIRVYGNIIVMRTLNNRLITMECPLESMVDIQGFSA